MKTLITFLGLLLFIKEARSNDIDRIMTHKDVLTFLEQKVDTAWKSVRVFAHANRKDTSMYRKGTFFRIDLDKNGRTDLVVNGRHLFAVVDQGKRGYKVLFIDKGTFLGEMHTLQDIIYKDGTPLLVLDIYDDLPPPDGHRTHLDTIILKYGQFYEYVSAPIHVRIERIRLSTSQCLGTCPSFELDIRADRTAIYTAKEYSERTGTFSSKIDRKSFDTLQRILDYIHLDALGTYYHVNWTDDQTTTLEITYDKGRKKTIIDYGMIGTYGLQHLYEKLFTLRTTQAWK